MGEKKTYSGDPLSRSQRSERMSRIKSKNTKPEMFIRRLVHGLGYRYRLHRKDLPGKPALFFPGRKKVFFVHGCFWHLHGCSHYRHPKSKLDFGVPKLEQNRIRDKLNQEVLSELGWRLLVIWEGQLKDTNTLSEMIKRFLEDE